MKKIENLMSKETEEMVGTGAEERFPSFETTLHLKVTVENSSQSCPNSVDNIMLRGEDYPEVIWVHAAFTPSRMETAVEIRSPKVDLVFIHLRCNLLSPGL